MDRESLRIENRLRHERMERENYDPLKGNPHDRSRVKAVRGGSIVYLPVKMVKDAEYDVTMPVHDFDMLRFRHDFEYWAVKCVKISHKTSKESVPFVLNRPQRRLLHVLEERRLAGVPIRLILLKARQWGASTMVQIYFAWIQIVHLRNWHSLICAHVKDTAATIRGMYTHLLENYPREYWEEECAPEFRPYERMSNVRIIPGRGCRVTVCSSENQESTRGMDCSMAHMSEVAFWKDSQLHNPVDLIRSIAAGIARSPMTIVVMESTANGVGNFFHKEWLRAVEGKSDKTPFFVGWHEAELHTEKVEDPMAFYNSLNDYERELWDEHGCTLEAIMWYRRKSAEYTERRSMMAEFPTTAEEAFCATESSVFRASDVERLRAEGCVVEPERGEVLGSYTGVPSDLSAPRFQPSPTGKARIWRRPRHGGVYIASLDIGGRTRLADYSVVTVLDRHLDTPDDTRPEVVAQWRGHIDHDLLAWRAAAMARWYNDALLVVESNTWEGGSEGRGQYILSMLADAYANMYHRRSEGTASGLLPGFHTNVRTKASVIANLIAVVRDGRYVEREPGACDELMQYEALADGSYAARRGCHDDMLMSRAIALWIHVSDDVYATCRISESDYKALMRQ